ncbi:MAG: phosphate signaling complex protein PhoU [Planctomycetales bacterium]|nr:phosphate signaling complex protein PhoU [Planctomycetales bacterium]
MRDSFRRHIHDLEKRILALGEAVETAIRSSVKALQERDLDTAEKIIQNDELINRQRWEIEENCITLIAMQQPVASDLREIITILNIVTELERMGDYAEGIAKIVLLLGKEPPVKPFVEIPVMAEKAINMLRQSMDAFIRRDAKTAEAICAMDDEVDALHDKVYNELIQYMINQPQTVTRATYQIWTAHNLERIADRVTNICERTIYLATGLMPKLVNISKY